jgi:XTP/dITP diphosphohydrolase
VKIFCATTNRGKLREFRMKTGIEVEPLPGMESMAPCAETGTTFEENAVQKALCYGVRTEGFLIAEDSGIEVDALGGAPGVWSARFAGANATDDDNNRLLLEKLANIRNRAARYVSVIALAKAGRIEATFRGEVEGEITPTPRGSNGFGYDPLFFYPPFGCTFGEAEADQKLTVSHRGRALDKLAQYLAVTFSVFSKPNSR